MHQIWLNQSKVEILNNMFLEHQILIY